jgi:hypothetical protein
MNSTHDINKKIKIMKTSADLIKATHKKQFNSTAPINFN